jgi:hypothetical protein
VRSLVVLPVVALALLAAGCGGSSAGDPETAAARPDTPDGMLKRVLAEHFRGQYRLAYDSLHPSHKALVTRENYAYCVGRVLTTIELGPVKTVDVVDAPLHRNGIPQTTAKQVTLKITAVEGKMRDSWEQSFRAVRVGGRWTWILPDSDVDDYRAGRCPPG